MAQLHHDTNVRSENSLVLESLSSSSSSSSTPTINPQAFQKSPAKTNSGTKSQEDPRDPQNPDFDFLNQAFEEFTIELEESIRKRCANSPLHTVLLKYINSKNFERES